MFEDDALGEHRCEGITPFHEFLDSLHNFYLCHN